MTGLKITRSFGLDDAADVSSDEAPESDAPPAQPSYEWGARAVEVDSRSVLVEPLHPDVIVSTADADPDEGAALEMTAAVVPPVALTARSRPSGPDPIDTACCGRDRASIDRSIVPAGPPPDPALVSDPLGHADHGRRIFPIDRAEEPLPLAAHRRPLMPSVPDVGRRSMSPEPAAQLGWPSVDTARDWRKYAGFALRVAAYGIAAWFAYVVLAVLLYRFVDPPASNLMVWTGLTGRSVEHTWVPFDRISPSLSRAVIVSEDARFCRHYGVDFYEIAAAVARARNGVPRGASTITMQVAKNLFLWPGKSYLRKVLEVPITLLIEVFWSKSRILEVYLNIAEWGRGTFGAEAAARHHFGRAAARLSDREAALLAVSLPNPIVRNAGRPGPATERLARLIQVRARAAGGSTYSCLAR